MAGNRNNELFPEDVDPKRKLRGFSRAASIPPTSTNNAQPEKQQAKRKQDKSELNKESKPKKIIVKGYGDPQSQEPPIDKHATNVTTTDSKCTDFSSDKRKSKRGCRQ